MNPKVYKALSKKIWMKVQYSIVAITCYGMPLHAMEKEMLIEEHNPKYEMHPLLYVSVESSLDEIKKKRPDLFLDDDRRSLDAPISAVKKTFSDYYAQGSWLLDVDMNQNVFMMNTTCGLGLIELIQGNIKQGVRHIYNAAGEQSSWGKYYMGILLLRSGEKLKNLNPAYDYFNEAASQKVAGVEPSWYRYLMFVLNSPGTACHDNALLWIDKYLYGHAKDQFLYPLAVYASRNDDQQAEVECLHKAVLSSNMHQTYAFWALRQRYLARSQYAYEAVKDLADNQNNGQACYLIGCRLPDGSDKRERYMAKAIALKQSKKTDQEVAENSEITMENSDSKEKDAAQVRTIHSKILAMIKDMTNLRDLVEKLM